MKAAEVQSLSEWQKTEAVEELARLLQSEYFSASRRCSNFLEYSTRYVIEGRPIEELKERVIGIEVFHKPADYDTAQDNIVRVTANEVRKRLAQYYAEAAKASGPIIHLQSGSYAVHFEWPHEPQHAPVTENHRQPKEAPLPVSAATETARRVRMGWKMLVAVVGIAVAGFLIAGVIYLAQRGTDVVREVWAPIFDNQRVAMIIIAQPHAYRLTTAVDDPQVPAGELIPMPDAYVGVGDAFAMADVVKILSDYGKSWQLIPSNAAPSETLFSGPIVMIGNRSNRWSHDMLENQRFYFGKGDEICDRANPAIKWTLPHLTPDWKTDEDFAIVSRFINPASGQPVIAIAGFTNYGTQAAGDFITNRSWLSEALHKAPKDWQQHNFEFVLHMKILGNTPERPTVIASNFS